MANEYFLMLFLLQLRSGVEELPSCAQAYITSSEQLVWLSTAVGSQSHTTASLVLLPPHVFKTILSLYLYISVRDAPRVPSSTLISFRKGCRHEAWDEAKTKTPVLMEPFCSFLRSLGAVSFVAAQVQVSAMT